MQNHTVIQAFDPLVFLVVANHHVVVAEVIAQCLGDFRIEEAQQLITVVHQFDQNTQAAEDRGVFTADHASTVDDQFAWGVAEAEDGVAVVDTLVAEIDISRAIRA